MSSSGVQRIGAAYPCARQTSSTCRRSVAFAICATFRVKTKSTPWTAATAMCAASAAACDGKGTRSISQAADSATSVVTSGNGRPDVSARRRSAASGSPARSSSSTTCEITRSNADRRVSHDMMRFTLREKTEGLARERIVRVWRPGLQAGGGVSARREPLRTPRPLEAPRRCPRASQGPPRGAAPGSTPQRRCAATPRPGSDRLPPAESRAASRCA